MPVPQILAKQRGLLVTLLLSLDSTLAFVLQDMLAKTVPKTSTSVKLIPSLPWPALEGHTHIMLQAHLPANTEANVSTLQDLSDVNVLLASQAQDVKLTSMNAMQTHVKTTELVLTRRASTSVFACLALLVKCVKSTLMSVSHLHALMEAFVLTWSTDSSVLVLKASQDPLV